MAIHTRKRSLKSKRLDFEIKTRLRFHRGNGIAVKPEVADRYQIWRVFGIGDGGDVSIVDTQSRAIVREKKIGQALII